MITFPNAKINIGLRVTEKRPDGFHNIQTCFYPIKLCDALEIVESDKLELQATGRSIPGKDSENLCLRAYHLLKKDYALPNVKLHLHKVIPSGAGLGGGSSDAAFTLKMISAHFNLVLGEELLSFYAEQLGSDCSFFIKNKPCIGESKGELLRETALDLSHYGIVLVYPNLQVSTAEAYADIKPQTPNEHVEDILSGMEVAHWKDHLVNDFEKSVFTRYPQLAALKKDLYDNGAVYAAMSGSGSSVYGFFEVMPEMQFPSHYFVWKSMPGEF